MQYRDQAGGYARQVNNANHPRHFLQAKSFIIFMPNMFGSTRTMSQTFLRGDVEPRLIGRQSAGVWKPSRWNPVSDLAGIDIDHGNGVESQRADIERFSIAARRHSGGDHAAKCR